MGENIQIRDEMQPVKDRRFSGMAKPGRKQYTPMERIYFQRIEMQILLGILIVELEKGETFNRTAERSVEILFRKIKVEASPQQLRNYKRMLYTIYNDFRSILK